MPWGTRLRDVPDRSPVHLQAAFPHTHFHSVKWKYEIFMNTLEDHKMHVSPEVPRGRKQNMCFVNIARHTLKRCGFTIIHFYIAGWAQGIHNELINSVSTRKSISVTRFQNSNLLQHHSILKLGLLFTESHFEITIMAIKCQIYGCTKSRRSQGSDNERGVVKEGARSDITPQTTSTHILCPFWTQNIVAHFTK